MRHSLSDQREGALWRISAPTSRTHYYRDLAIPRYRVNAEVEHGLVTLQGVVERPYRKSCAEAIVRRVPGVIGVRNASPSTPRKSSVRRPHLPSLSTEARRGEA